MIHIGICDDEKDFLTLEAKEIQYLMQRDYSELQYEITQYTSGKELLNSLLTNNIDLLFLDIELGKEDGLEVSRRVVQLNKEIKIVFVTSHDNLVFKTFISRPNGFIKKRVFRQEIDIVMSQIIAQMIEDNQIIEVGERKSPFKIYLNSIYCIDTYKHNLVIRLRLGEVVVRDKISRLLPILEEQHFVRISRGSVVNMKYILNINDSTITMINGNLIQINRNRVKEVHRIYNKYRGLIQL